MNHINEINIRYKKKKFKSNCNDKITDSAIAYKILKSNWNLDTIELVEEFKVLLLDNSNQLNGIYAASTGGLTNCMIDKRLIFGVILKTASIKIVLAHNHPSGNLHPSQADIELTKQIKKVAEFMDIDVMDHIILTSKGYYSFADKGIL
ncbi:MAG: JAB domain-containing protein [Chitinophagales bacterium]